MRSICIVSVAVALCGVAAAADPYTALQACRVLPKTAAAGFSGVAARGGSPNPAQWLVLVNDAKSESGVREFTITKGVVISSKEGSEVAGELTRENRISLSKVRVDSDAAAELTASYAAANHAAAATYDFDLRQSGEEAAPLWTVTALDAAGARLGSVVIAANNGAVVSHEGFATAPTPADLTDQVALAPVEPEKKTAKSGSSSSSSGEKKRPGTFHRVGGHLQKFFTGKNTIGK